MLRPAAAFALAIFGLVVAPAMLPAQSGGLRREITNLFILGSGDDPLFLGGSADPNNPQSIQVHGAHFIPAAVAENRSMIGFISGAIASSIRSVPIGASSGGVTFRFEGGVPVKTSTSAGPIFAERAQTLGRGRALAGIGRSTFQFSTLRGQPLDNLEMVFTHENVDFPNCDAIFSGECSEMGMPGWENELIAFRLDLDLDVEVTTFYLTYGIFDRMDVGVVVPLVRTSLHGESVAQIIPFVSAQAPHFFGGTPEDPELTASRTVSGSSFGIGDVAVRTKIGIRHTEHAGLALLGEARFATGSEEDLLGAGGFSARGLAVISGRAGNFSPHANVGYAYHSRSEDRLWNDALLATAGFDHLMSERVTLAVDVVSELQIGESKLRLPDPVSYTSPYRRTVQPTRIPDQRDDIVNGSIGAKFTLPRGFTVVGNALVPLNRGGMRPNVIYTTAVELNF